MVGLSIVGLLLYLGLKFGDWNLGLKLGDLNPGLKLVDWHPGGWSWFLYEGGLGFRYLVFRSFEFWSRCFGWYSVLLKVHLPLDCCHCSIISNLVFILLIYFIIPFSYESCCSCSRPMSCLLTCFWFGVVSDWKYLSNFLSEMRNSSNVLNLAYWHWYLSSGLNPFNSLLCNISSDSAFF